MIDGCMIDAGWMMDGGTERWMDGCSDSVKKRSKTVIKEFFHPFVKGNLLKFVLVSNDSANEAALL